jgi:hypothetical protein
MPYNAKLLYFRLINLIPKNSQHILLFDLCPHLPWNVHWSPIRPPKSSRFTKFVYWCTFILGTLSIRTPLYVHNCTMLAWANIPPLLCHFKILWVFLNCKTCTCFNFYHNYLYRFWMKDGNKWWIDAKGTEFEFTWHLTASIFLIACGRRSRLLLSHLQDCFAFYYELKLFHLYIFPWLNI